MHSIRSRPLDRRWLALVLAAAVLIFGLVGRALAACDYEIVGTRHQPNVVLILADDLDMRLFEETPGLADLPGRHYPNAFTVSPLCCPSRASLLTGLHVHRHGVWENVAPNGGHFRFLPHENCTLPVWLQAAGYQTAYVGKYLNGYGSGLTSHRYIPPGWDDWQGFPISNRYHGYNVNDNGEVMYPEQEQTAEIADRVVAYLEVAQAPFFLMAAPFAPHETAGAERTPETTGPAYRHVLAERLADMVTRVVENLPPDTVLIFTSDNGYHEVPRPGKRLPYDSDTQVPLTVVGLDGRDDRLVANIDVTATIAEWAGVSREMDGWSLFGPERDEILIELDGWEAVRTHDELTITWPDGRVEVTTTGCPDERPC